MGHPREFHPSRRPPALIWTVPSEPGYQALVFTIHHTSLHLALLTMSGPTLSPVAALCLPWLPSQSGKVELFQQRQYTFLPSS